MSGDISAFADNLKAARKARGWSLENLAAEAETSKGYLSELERRIRPIPPGRMLERLCDALGTTVEALVGAPVDRPLTVPLVGYVAADPSGTAVLFSYGQGPFDEVPAPDDATSSTVATEVRGTSLGPAFDRWLVFYDDVRSPVTSDQHNQLCVVGAGEQVFVKILKPAGAPGRFHLISNGGEETMFDVEVAWAARVIDMKPRR